jgi:hypothetical protein
MPEPGSTSAPDARRIPLVVGVAGHRQVDVDRAELEAEVRWAFEQLKEQLPHTPLTLLSPLAAGADRLVARIALEQGLTLVVPVQEGTQDAPDDSDTSPEAEEYRALLGRAARTEELSIRGGADADPRGGRRLRRRRVQAVRPAGRLDGPQLSALDRAVGRRLRPRARRHRRRRRLDARGAHRGRRVDPDLAVRARRP